MFISLSVLLRGLSIPLWEYPVYAPISYTFTFHLTFYSLVGVSKTMGFPVLSLLAGFPFYSLVGVSDYLALK